MRIDAAPAASSGGPLPSRACLLLFAALAPLLVEANQNTSTTPPPAPASNVLCNNGTCVECAGFEGVEYWYEQSCPEHVSLNTTFCVAEIFQNTETKEGEKTIKQEEKWSHDGAPYSIIVIFGSFGLGALVRFLFKDTPVPYTVVLFLIGMAWGGIGKLTWAAEHLHDYVQLGDMNPHNIFHIFLPVLIFESAFAMQITTFKKVVWQCVWLAGPGLLFASFLTACSIRLFFLFIVDYAWTWEACLLLGTILSATDPVAVVALLKELGADAEISTLIEGESLFNDGTAIVVFKVLLSAVLTKNCAFQYTPCCGSLHDSLAHEVSTGAESHIDMSTCLLDEHDFTCSIPDSVGAIIVQFLITSLGGPAIGLVVGGLAVFSLQRVFNDALIEVTITLVAAYVTFFLCEGIFLVSGVLGVVACGLLMSFHHHSVSPEVEHTMHHFWEMIVYLTNTMIFILAGMIVSLKAFDDLKFLDVIFLLALYGAINIIRGVVLLISIPLFPFMRMEYVPSVGESVLIAWGGLRGAVGLALALVVQADSNVVFPSVRQKFIFHVAGIVVLTLCVNGVTTKKVVQMFKLNKTPKRNRIMMRDRFRALGYECFQSIQDLRMEALYYDTNWKILDGLTDLAAGTLASSRHVDPYNKKDAVLAVTEADERVEVKHVYLNTVQGSVHKQYSQGTLDATCARKLLRMVDTFRDSTSSDDVLFEASMLEWLFEMPSWVAKDVSTIEGGWRKWLLVRRWRVAFNTTLGFRACHGLLSSRAPQLLPRVACGRVLTHCKRVSHEATEQAERAIYTHPEISCQIKDSAELRQVVRAKLKALNTKPATLAQCTAEEALQETEWFQAAPPAARERLLNAWHMKVVKEVVVRQGDRVEQFNEPRKNLSGLYVVVTGVVQIRMGRRGFLFGGGYTVGMQQLMTPDSVSGQRFSNVYAETQCRMLYVPFEVLTELVDAHADLAAACWELCGRNAAEILMGIHPKFRTPHHTPRRIATLASRGTHEVVLDPAIYSAAATRKVKLPEYCTVFMLRGRCWEYEIEKEEEEVAPGDSSALTLVSDSTSEGPASEKVNLERFPVLIPGTFKFATFTEHAVIFIVPDEVRPGDQARKLWGRLRAKIKAVTLWVGLRGEEYTRDALATCLGVAPRPSTPVLRSSPRSSHNCSAMNMFNGSNLASLPPTAATTTTTPTAAAAATAAAEQQKSVIESLKAENKTLQATLKRGVGFGGGGVGAPFSPLLLSSPVSGNPSSFSSRMAAPSAPAFPSAASASAPVGGAAPRSAFAPPLLSAPATPLGVLAAAAAPAGSPAGSPAGLQLQPQPQRADVVHEIRQLGVLQTEGLLTADEFAAAKARLLDLPALSPGSSQQGAGRQPQQHQALSSPYVEAERRRAPQASPAWTPAQADMPSVEELKRRYLGKSSPPVL